MVLVKLIDQGVAAVVFEMRPLEKLNDFFFPSKPWKDRGGVGEFTM